MPAKTIQLKFDFGDTVYRIAYKPCVNYLGRICPVCQGTGRFISPASQNEKECPGVNGYMCVKGKMAASYTNYAVPVKTQITDIILDVDGVMYEADYNPYPEDSLYTTLKEAQDICDIRNSKIKYV